MSKPNERKLRLGVAGLGRAFTVMLPTFTGDARVQLVAAADTRAEARQRFVADFSATSYASIEELCADPAVEAVYIATPHRDHAQHADACGTARQTSAHREANGAHSRRVRNNH